MIQSTDKALIHLQYNGIENSDRILLKERP